LQWKDNTTINKVRLFLCKPPVRLKPDLAVQCPTAKASTDLTLMRPRNLMGLGLRYEVWIDPLALLCKAERV